MRKEGGVNVRFITSSQEILIDLDIATKETFDSMTKDIDLFDNNCHFN